MLECIYQDEREGDTMKKRDEFADLNRDRKRSGMVVFAIAVLAVCISGVLCARKLQLEQRYISFQEVTAVQSEC